MEDRQIVESKVSLDDVNCEPVDPSFTVQAMQEEMRGFDERGVNHHVPRGVAEADQEGRPIGVRWVDVSKGTKEVPKARSRPVGHEFAIG